MAARLNLCEESLGTRLLGTGVFRRLKFMGGTTCLLKVTKGYSLLLSRGSAACTGSMQSLAEVIHGHISAAICCCGHMALTVYT